MQLVKQRRLSFGAVFFFNDTATTEIYTLSLHDALPIFAPVSTSVPFAGSVEILTASSVFAGESFGSVKGKDRKSTRLNSSHSQISEAVSSLHTTFTEVTLTVSVFAD